MGALIRSPRGCVLSSWVQHRCAGSRQIDVPNIGRRSAAPRPIRRSARAPFPSSHRLATMRDPRWTADSHWAASGSCQWRANGDTERTSTGRAPVRRGAAWPPAGATEQLPGSAAGSLACWQVASPPSRHVAERRLCRRPQQRGSASQRCRGARMSGCHRTLVACPRPPSASRVQHSPVQCPASGRCPVSASGVRASGVRCPVSSARCPMPGVRVRCSASVSTLSAPVSSWSAGAAGSHTSRDRPGRVTT